MSKEKFINLKFLVNNPLADRVAVIFGYSDTVNEIDFKAFLLGVSVFNAHGQREQKLKTVSRYGCLLCLYINVDF